MRPVLRCITAEVREVLRWFVSRDRSGDAQPANPGSELPRRRSHIALSGRHGGGAARLLVWLDDAEMQNPLDVAASSTQRQRAVRGR